MRKLKIIFPSLLILLGISLFLYKYTRKVEYHGYQLHQGKAPDFTLINQYGTETSLSQFRGNVVLLYFGYTSCPDVCPMTLSVLKESIQRLGNSRDRVKVLFITIDPGRDTSEKLKPYLAHFERDFLGLTSSPEKIAKVAKDYHIFYEKEVAEPNGEYSMDHATPVYVIGPKGQLLLKYSVTNLKPDWIAEDIRKILG